METLPTIYPIYQAIKLNNEGVRQTICGNVQPAVKRFAKALQVLDSVVSKQEMYQLQNNDTMPSSPYSLRKAKILLAQFTRVPVERNGNTDHTSSRATSNNGFMFDNLVTFSRSPSRKNCYNAADCQIYCAGILLNLAIVYHRDGLRKQQQTEKKTNGLLKKAESFYQRVLKLVPGSGGTDEKIMIKLVAMNNLAQIRLGRKSSSHDKNDTSYRNATTEVLQLLFAHLVGKQSSSCKTSGIVDEYGEFLLDSEELKGILRNVMAMANRLQ